MRSGSGSAMAHPCHCACTLRLTLVAEGILYSSSLTWNGEAAWHSLPRHCQRLGLAFSGRV